METNEHLRIVLDTNVVLNALSRKLPYRHLLRQIIVGGYHLFVTTEILLEYEEKITQFYSKQTAVTLLDALLASQFVHQVEVFFRFNMIKDLDDNKFVDCAFAANAHYLVTDDRAFVSLKNLDFPKIEVIKLDMFSKLLTT